MRRWMSLFFGAMRGRSADAGPGDFEDLHLAACALLVELVYADEDFAEAERRHLEGLLLSQGGRSQPQHVGPRSCYKLPLRKGSTQHQAEGSNAKFAPTRELRRLDHARLVQSQVEAITA